MEFFISLSAALIFILVGCISKLLKYMNEDQLRESVAWCVSSNNNVRNNLSITAYIHNKQLHHALPNEYRLTLHTSCPDKQFVNDILAEYQHSLSENYFMGNLIPLKSKYVLTGEPYFWISLQRYLCLKEDRLYDVRGKKLYDYSEDKKLLTEDGIRFYKLLYITFLANMEIGYEPPYTWAVDKAKRYIETGEL